MAENEEKNIDPGMNESSGQVIEDASEEKKGESAAAGRGPIALPKEPKGNETCPVCGKRFRFVEGGAVRVVNGEVDMDGLDVTDETEICEVCVRPALWVKMSS